MFLGEISMDFSVPLFLSAYSQPICAVFLFMNVFSFALYGIDKQKAKKGLFRIRERTLLLSSFFAGALGAFAAMIVFRHKTKKPIFRFFVPLCGLVQTVFILWLLCFARFG
ncbi:MAG: DUF1294 domain-containing protein [Clostridiales bacterium]|nr:DUF1294 domain-containing protein [Clostridiales bacterium]